MLSSGVLFKAHMRDTIVIWRILAVIIPAAQTRITVTMIFQKARKRNEAKKTKIYSTAILKATSHKEYSEDE